MIWLISIVLAVPVAALHLAGVPLIWSVVIAVTVLLIIVVAGKGKAKGPTAVLGTAGIVLVLAGAVAVAHIGGPAAKAPAVVTWQPGTYSSYGNPSFTVGAWNNGESPGTVHTITVRFVNDLTAQEITDVSEPVNVTVPAGQGQELTYTAPPQLVSTAARDRDVAVTVISNS